jgi:hypothetical protein
LHATRLDRGRSILVPGRSDTTKPRSGGLRSALLTLGFSAGLGSTAFGVWLIVEARCASKTDVGMITSGLEAIVGLLAAMFGIGALLAAAVAEYSTRKPRSIPEPDYIGPGDRSARLHGARRGQPLDPNGGFHDVTKTSIQPRAIDRDRSSLDRAREHAP